MGVATAPVVIYGLLSSSNAISSAPDLHSSKKETTTKPKKNNLILLMGAYTFVHMTLFAF